MTATTQLINSYHQLKNKWMASSRGQGGVNAVKGFDFQLLSALLKIAKSDLNPNCAVTEGISDISEIKGGNIIITQSKLCLSSKAVYGALDELWDLFILINSDFPELKDVVNFIVLGSSQELKDPQQSISNWRAKTQNPNNSSLLDLFITRISTSIDSNPLERLVEVLISEYAVSKPFTLVNEWLGKLYRSISEN